jgi:hypothetical protein
VETAALGDVLAAVRDGLSGVLVLRGEAGIGKTALLDWAAGQADDMQVARVGGVESEMNMGFAGLHQLLVPFLGGLEALPPPQRQALGSAFGLVTGPPPDRFLVGLAALTLMTDAAGGRPVLCLADDALWLDQVSVEVLGFVARRLYADRVGMLFSVREGEERAAALAGLSELTVGGLADEVAHELLATSAGARVDRQVSRRIVAGTAGNPLALVELAGELTTAELSGAVPLDWPLRFGGRLEELYLSRVRVLPADTQTLLLVAAADTTGEPELIWKAAGYLGIDPEAGQVAGMERLVSWQPRVRFRHPLMRSAAYYAAQAAMRRRAHDALAAVTDPVADPDRRAWHRAEAATGPDEQVAAELERSADRARRRGGWASGAAFLERAAALTPGEDDRGRRMLAAAEDRLVAGEASAARALLSMAAPLLVDELAGAGPGGWRAGACMRSGRCPRPRRCCLTRHECSSRLTSAWPGTPCWTRFQPHSSPASPGPGWPSSCTRSGRRRRWPIPRRPWPTCCWRASRPWASAATRLAPRSFAGPLRRWPATSRCPTTRCRTSRPSSLPPSCSMTTRRGTSWRSGGWQSYVTGAHSRPCWSGSASSWASRWTRAALRTPRPRWRRGGRCPTRRVTGHT